MKAKILWSEADRIHRIITRNIKNGKVQVIPRGKEQGSLDINSIPHSVLEQKDKLFEALIFACSGIVAWFMFMITGDAIISLIGFCVVIVPLKFMVNRTIIYPFYVAKWNCCMPFNFNTAKPSCIFGLRGRLKKGGKQEKIGELEFYEIKAKEPPEGIEMYTPQSFTKMSKNATLAEIIKGDMAVKPNWLLMIVFLALGFFMALVFFPDGLQAAMQAAQQAAAPAAATPPA